MYDYCFLLGRVFANGPGDLGSIPGRVIPKTFKMVLDASLLNTQQYNVRIKGKVEQSRERSSAPLHLSVVAIEKGAFCFFFHLLSYAFSMLFIITGWCCYFKDKEKQCVFFLYINDLSFHPHHHHVTPSARISLTLSRHPSLSPIASGRFSGPHPVSAQSCCM